MRHPRSRILFCSYEYCLLHAPPKRSIRQGKSLLCCPPSGRALFGRLRASLHGRRCNVLPTRKKARQKIVNRVPGYLDADLLSLKAGDRLSQKLAIAISFGV